MKKIFSVIVCLISIIILVTNSYAIEIDDSIGSAYLVDSATGNVLYEYNSEESANITGLNKLMGVALVFDAIRENRLSLNDKIIVSDSVRNVGGAIAFLEVGQEYSVEDLLKAVITVNANDAMIVLAEASHGNVDEFIKKMNVKAKELGMGNTNYTSLTGFVDENQYSTAKDVSIIASYLLRDGNYTKFSQEYMYELKHPSGKVTQIVNTNRLIKTYEQCDGMMTGSNKSENYSIAATGKKGDMRLVAIVLGAPNSDIRNSTAKELLEYGFVNFVSKKIYAQNDVIAKDVKIKSSSTTFDAVLENNLTVIVDKGQVKKIEKDYVLNENPDLPIKKGNVIGEATAKIGENIIGKVNIIADRDVEKVSVGICIKKMLTLWLGT